MWREAHVPELPRIVDDLGIGAFFHIVLTSGIVGYEKPHDRMFEAAVANSVPARPIWMLGDNVHADCLPVGAFGARAILVRATGDFDPRAEDLWQALAVIES